MTADTPPPAGDRDAVAEAEVARFLRCGNGFSGDATGSMSLRAVRALLARAEAAEARVKELEAALATKQRELAGAYEYVTKHIPAPEVPRA